MLDWMREIFDNLGNALLSLLPLSPFTEVINSLEKMPFLGYINWFFPFGAMVKIASGWLVVIGIYYAYILIARWLKIIS